jgi:hypothetical protein
MVTLMLKAYRNAQRNGSIALSRVTYFAWSLILSGRREAC